ncbi:MAG: septum formation family protein, partial [Jiangellaceae bacterium]|nr:septum formation family protein [Jiangellaceae bacterium]
GTQAVDTAAQEICVAEFEDFVGIPYEDSVLDVGFLAPTEESWREGDREVLCTVFDPAEEVSGSLRGAKR